MKNDCLIGMLLGVIVGGVAVTLYKPAQNVIKKGTDFVKEEAENLLNKNKTYQD